MMTDLMHTKTYVGVMDVSGESVLDGHWSCHCHWSRRRRRWWWCYYCLVASLFDWIERMETVGRRVYSMSCHTSDVEHDETSRQADWRQLMVSTFHLGRSSLHIWKSYSIWNKQKTRSEHVYKSEERTRSGVGHLSLSVYQCSFLVHSTLTVQAICRWARDHRSSDVVYHATFVLLDCQ